MATSVGDLRRYARWRVKSLLRPLLYRFPPIGLQPERLHLWLGALIETSDLHGAALEIGCSVGGTAVYSERMLRRLAMDRPYVCVDTFGGFVPEQFEHDGALGTPARRGDMFSASSIELVRRIVDGLGGVNVQLVEGDIVTIADSALPVSIAACLIDVDLSEPVCAALERVHPRMQPGGIILVDDCPEGSEWKARAGYERFMSSMSLVPEYRFGMGIVRVPR